MEEAVTKSKLPPHLQPVQLKLPGTKEVITLPRAEMTIEQLVDRFNFDIDLLWDEATGDVIWPAKWIVDCKPAPVVYIVHKRDAELDRADTLIDYEYRGDSMVVLIDVPDEVTPEALKAWFQTGLEDEQPDLVAARTSIEALEHKLRTIDNQISMLPNATVRGRRGRDRGRRRCGRGLVCGLAGRGWDHMASHSYTVPIALLPNVAAPLTSATAAPLLVQSANAQTAKEELEARRRRAQLLQKLKEDTEVQLKTVQERLERIKENGTGDDLYALKKAKTVVSSQEGAAAVLHLRTRRLLPAARGTRAHCPPACLLARPLAARAAPFHPGGLGGRFPRQRPRA